MADVQNVASTTGSTAASTSTVSNAVQNSQVSQDRFLTLLVAQLKSQDPLNPMDNAQLTTQLAQISTVDGINKLNTTMTSLASQFSAIDQLNATSMIGHSVLIKGTEIDLSHTADGKAVAGGGIDLTSAAEQLRVQVKDASGALVRTIDLGPQPAGQHVFAWDGKTDTGVNAVDGQYSFSVIATAANQPVTNTTLSIAHVDGVQRSNGVAQLNVGNLGLISPNDVVQIY